MWVLDIWICGDGRVTSDIGSRGIRTTIITITITIASFFFRVPKWLQRLEFLVLH
uniref:Uncharacterized protein n=1 Tax=Picea sitchensis TaxID=3332 RepID=A9NL30_PICSI|nr:unknown [Picea sitchensis]